MKNRYFIFITHCLLITINQTYSAEIISRSIKAKTNLIQPASAVFFDAIHLDVKKEILKKLLNLYGVPIETITISPGNMTLCVLMIHQYASVKLFNKTFFELIQLPESQRNIIRKTANPSFMDRFSGCSDTVISEDCYKDICTLPSNITKGVKVKIQPDDPKHWRLCVATTCACGTCGICLSHTTGIVECSWCAGMCCLTGSMFCFVDTMLLCCMHCSKKCGVSNGFKPRRKIFS